MGGEPGRGKAVLVADDDRALCALLERALEPFATVTAVADAEAALELLAGGAFDAVISDFMLPGMSGLEFARKLRADPRTSRIRVLMISGHEPARLRQDALGAGVDAFLNKPFTLLALRGAVARLLSPHGEVASGQA